ncbi:flagellar protein FlaG [Sulfurimonas lithotrophica]|uniref:Flagellar protein FlaG n=1 Tax=Sulfurimonas lithotrophica TaxID=2590022 RepID=A0A5P8P0A0_9BACT|nr:flagellar protein FlaG [Sulfurimonas lithotrophica]QFR49031.1 flagellar protein FlaG [Sulfurimonas lithotrophica]
MDGIANVARQQQSQIHTTEAQGIKTEESKQPQVQQPDLVKASQEKSTKIDSKEQVEDLVKKLNDALAPMKTDLSFGVDLDDIFYVAVSESKTNKMIRRFPAEQAQDFLPKMQEVSGMLFDTKG